MYVCMYVWMNACMHACIYVCMYVCRAFSLLAIWCLGPRVQILHSAEEHNLSPFDLNIACLCHSIEINNKYVCMYVCMHAHVWCMCVCMYEGGIGSEFQQYKQERYGPAGRIRSISLFTGNEWLTVIYVIIQSYFVKSIHTWYYRDKYLEQLCETVSCTKVLNSVWI